MEEWRSGLAAEFTCAGVCPGMRAQPQRGRFLLPSLISFRDTLANVSSLPWPEREQDLDAKLKLHQGVSVVPAEMNSLSFRKALPEQIPFK